MMGMWMFFLMVIPSGSNDLLDYVLTEDYWKVKGVTVSVESMLGELDRAADTAPSPGAASVRRLMAIRTLGELKKEEARPRLQALLSSQEPFVADYARHALSVMAGTPYTRPAVSAGECDEDLRLMPRTCGLVAQTSAFMLFSEPKPLDFDAVFEKAQKAMGPMGGMQDRARARQELTQAVVGIADMVGNLRISGLTFGLADNVGDRTGYVAIVLRGRYDAKAVRAVLTPLVEETREVNGLSVLCPDDEFAFIPVSDQRLVIIGGPSREQLPVEEVTAALTAGPGSLRLAPETATLLERVDRKAPFWLVSRMSETYRTLDLLAPFDWLTVVGTKAADNALALELAGEGKEAALVAEAVARFNRYVTEGIASMKREEQMAELTKPYIDFMESLKAEANGTRVTATAAWKGSSLGTALLGLFVGVSSSPAPAAKVEARPLDEEKTATKD